MQVLKQRQAQHDGHGPKFTQLERLHFLIGLEKQAEIFLINLTVGVPDQFQDDIVDAREAFARSGYQAGKLPAVTGGEMGAGQFDLFLNQVVVVQQPFRGRRDAPPQPDAVGDGLMAAVDAALAFRKLVEQPFMFAQNLRLVPGGEEFRVVFELADAEQFGAQTHLLLHGRGMPRRAFVGQRKAWP